MSGGMGFKKYQVFVLHFIYLLRTCNVDWNTEESFFFN